MSAENLLQSEVHSPEDIKKVDNRQDIENKHIVLKILSDEKVTLNEIKTLFEQSHTHKDDVKNEFQRIGKDKTVKGAQNAVERNKYIKNAIQNDNAEFGILKGSNIAEIKEYHDLIPNDDSNLSKNCHEIIDLVITSEFVPQSVKDFLNAVVNEQDEDKKTALVTSSEKILTECKALNVCTHLEDESDTINESLNTAKESVDFEAYDKNLENAQKKLERLGLAIAFIDGEKAKIEGSLKIYEAYLNKGENPALSERITLLKEDVSQYEKMKTELETKKANLENKLEYHSPITEEEVKNKYEELEKSKVDIQIKIEEAKKLSEAESYVAFAQEIYEKTIKDNQEEKRTIDNQLSLVKRYSLLKFKIDREKPPIDDAQKKEIKDFLNKSRDNYTVAKCEEEIAKLHEYSQLISNTGNEDLYQAIKKKKEEIQSLIDKKISAAEENDKLVQLTTNAQKFDTFMSSNDTSGKPRYELLFDENLQAFNTAVDQRIKDIQASKNITVNALGDNQNQQKELFTKISKAESAHQVDEIAHLKNELYFLQEEAKKLQKSIEQYDAIVKDFEQKRQEIQTDFALGERHGEKLEEHLEDGGKLEHLEKSRITSYIQLEYKNITDKLRNISKAEKATEREKAKTSLMDTINQIVQTNPDKLNWLEKRKLKQANLDIVGKNANKGLQKLQSLFPEEEYSNMHLKDKYEAFAKSCHPIDVPDPAAITRKMKEEIFSKMKIKTYTEEEIESAHPLKKERMTDENKYAVRLTEHISDLVQTKNDQSKLKNKAEGIQAAAKEMGWNRITGKGLKKAEDLRKQVNAQIETHDNKIQGRIDMYRKLAEKREDADTNNIQAKIENPYILENESSGEIQTYMNWLHEQEIRVNEEVKSKEKQIATAEKINNQSEDVKSQQENNVKKRNKMISTRNSITEKINEINAHYFQELGKDSKVKDSLAKAGITSELKDCEKNDIQKIKGYESKKEYGVTCKIKNGEQENTIVLSRTLLQELAKSGNETTKSDIIQKIQSASQQENTSPVQLHFVSNSVESIS